MLCLEFFIEWNFGQIDFGRFPRLEFAFNTCRDIPRVISLKRTDLRNHVQLARSRNFFTVLGVIIISLQHVSMYSTRNLIETNGF